MPVNTSLLVNLLSWGTWLCFCSRPPQHPTRSGGTPSLHAVSTHTNVCSLLWAQFLRLLLTQLSVTLEKGNESRCFAGMANVSVRHRQLHSSLFCPLFPSREWGGGRGQGRTGQREILGISSWLGKSPPSPSLTARGGSFTPLTPPLPAPNSPHLSWAEMPRKCPGGRS